MFIFFTNQAKTVYFKTNHVKEEEGDLREGDLIPERKFRESGVPGVIGLVGFLGMMMTKVV